MVAIGLGFLALFSAISILVGNEDRRHQSDPHDDLGLWIRYGIR